MISTATSIDNCPEGWEPRPLKSDACLLLCGVTCRKQGKIGDSKRAYGGQGGRLGGALGGLGGSHGGDEGGWTDDQLACLCEDTAIRYSTCRLTSFATIHTSRISILNKMSLNFGISFISSFILVS